MRRKLTAGIAITAGLLLSGCAGVPVAVSFASLYANTLLVLRTEKGVTDHVISAVAEQDCGFVNVLNEGRYCTDAPAPDVVAMMSADPEQLRPIHEPVPPVMVAAASTTARTVTDVEPPALAGPAVISQAGQAASSRTASGKNSGKASGAVVVAGSFRDKSNALARKAALHRADVAVIPVSIQGNTIYRVVVPAENLSVARQTLAWAKAGGAPDAWLLNDHATSHTVPDSKPLTRTAEPAGGRGKLPGQRQVPSSAPMVTMVAAMDGEPKL